MSWNWTVRLVLPVLLTILTSIVFDIVFAAPAGFTVLDGMALALLAAAILGLGVWWLATWFPPP
jgi:hypothetical protein